MEAVQTVPWVFYFLATWHKTMAIIKWRQLYSWISPRMLYKKGCICSLTNKVASVSRPRKSGLIGTKRGTTYSAIHTTWEGWRWKVAQLRSKGWWRFTVPIRIPIPKAFLHSLSIRWLRASTESSRKLIGSSSSPILQAVPPKRLFRTMCSCQMMTLTYKMKMKSWRQPLVTLRSLQRPLTWVRTRLDKIWSWCTKIWPQ